jgi:hypothetical protein
MESIFLILSGVILVAGVLYWFWSHLQLTQKKVQLLENAVFELRGMMVHPPPGPGPGPGQSQGGSSGTCAAVPAEEENSGTAAAAAPVYTDLDDDDWADERGAEITHVSTPLEQISNPDLQPGGRIEVPAEAEAAVAQPEEQFRELFVGQDGGVTAAAAAGSTGPRTPESLESMPVKELRRLAEQRGISGADGMRKKEILAALRQQITSAPATATATGASAATVVVERTLDIVEEESVLGDTAEVPVLD